MPLLKNNSLTNKNTMTNNKGRSHNIPGIINEQQRIQGLSTSNDWLSVLEICSHFFYTLLRCILNGYDGELAKFYILWVGIIIYFSMHHYFRCNNSLWRVSCDV